VDARSAKYVVHAIAEIDAWIPGMISSKCLLLSWGVCTLLSAAWQTELGVYEITSLIDRLYMVHILAHKFRALWVVDGLICSHL